jgi:hypothetical protein
MTVIWDSAPTIDQHFQRSPGIQHPRLVSISRSTIINSLSALPAVTYRIQHHQFINISTGHLGFRINDWSAIPAVTYRIQHQQLISIPSGHLGFSTNN